MANDVQPADPAAELLAAAERSVPGWLRRITLDAARRGGLEPAAFGPALDQMVAQVSAATCRELARLLATDVDAQATNPLSVLRSAIAGPTEFLRRHGVEPPDVDRFVGDRFPDDVYGIGPATWSDVDPALHEPGLVWGAWKAMTVLRRRRDEGAR